MALVRVRAVAVESDRHVAVVAEHAKPVRVSVPATPLRHVYARLVHAAYLSTVREPSSILVIERQKFVATLAAASTLATVMSNRFFTAFSAVALLRSLLLRRLARVHVFRSASATVLAVSVESIRTTLIRVETIRRLDLIAANAMASTINNTNLRFWSGFHPTTLIRGST